MFPVTAPSASPHATMHVAHTTLSFLIILSQSLSNNPCSLCNFSNKCLTYLFLFFSSVELTISMSKLSLYPIFFICSLILLSLPTKIGIPSLEFLNAIAAHKPLPDNSRSKSKKYAYMEDFTKIEKILL